MVRRGVILKLRFPLSPTQTIHLAQHFLQRLRSRFPAVSPQASLPAKPATETESALSLRTPLEALRRGSDPASEPRWRHCVAALSHVRQVSALRAKRHPSRGYVFGVSSTCGAATGVGRTQRTSRTARTNLDQTKCATRASCKIKALTFVRTYVRTTRNNTQAKSAAFADAADKQSTAGTNQPRWLRNPPTLPLGQRAAEPE